MERMDREDRRSTVDRCSWGLCWIWRLRCQIDSLIGGDGDEDGMGEERR